MYKVSSHPELYWDRRPGALPLMAGHVEAAVKNAKFRITRA